MSVHLIKLAVGVEDVEHLAALQAQRARDNERAGLGPNPRHYTRQRPKREPELVDGGSIYWVIRGQVRVRQRVLGLDTYMDEDGKSRCALILDVDLVPVLLTAHRPFQGWRYLDPAKAPPDAGDANDDDAGGVPGELARDLGALGLL